MLKELEHVLYKGLGSLGRSQLTEIIPVDKEGMREDPGTYSPVSPSLVPGKNKIERITLGTIKGI